ncbi:putative ATP:cob(I)alamin adenosyltransferase [Pseudoramibacter alactolyticus ATCC 23263]|uniref:Putative ATP:cob(I)alamin adenosyltransferase n=1 Tax=Pseudoramibacter alactolyticus ATCC 23263 TaxID=887929 RepID=E6MI94_9FIRM|nr:cob(I)yrinic acid a,c-diamide adenosyltransferase [Pseudoramibacter alactolyticus]EFV01246.1 putative ATP:cob(I)alamin adenosyltransferase [Pseudoramibacter alactolyticus ATCC 23263]
MKVITEASLRRIIRSDARRFVLEKDKILSPAAREFLTDRKIAIVQERTAGKPPEEERPIVSPDEQKKTMPRAEEAATEKAAYIDFESGAFYTRKPEHMTQLFGNQLVSKDHPRIIFRGMLDAVQAEVILVQTEIISKRGSEKLASALEEVLQTLRMMMRCDVLDESFEKKTILGLNHDEIREHSHHPMRHYNIKQMVLPDKSLGADYARLNHLRTAIRRTEIAAVSAYREGGGMNRSDIVEGLNRLSSVLHIIMCRYLAGWYNDSPAD